MHVHGTYDTRTGDPSGSNALAIVFRIIVPIVVQVVAVLITRLWPTSVVRHVERSDPFNDGSAAAAATPPLRGYGNVIDNPLSRMPAMASVSGRPHKGGIGSRPGAYPGVLVSDDSSYIGTAPAIDGPQPWQMSQQAQIQNPPWLQNPGGDGSGAQLRHEVWRQMMLTQQAELTRQQQQRQSQRQRMGPWQTQQQQAAGSFSSMLGQRQPPPPADPTLSPLRFNDMAMSFGDFPTEPGASVRQQGGPPNAALPGQRYRVSPPPAVSPLMVPASAPMISAAASAGDISSPRIPAYLEPPPPSTLQQAPPQSQETVVTSFGPPVTPFNASKSLGRSRQRMK